MNRILRLLPFCISSVFLMLALSGNHGGARKKEDPYVKELEEAKSSYNWGNYESAANHLWTLWKKEPQAETSFYLAKSLFHLELSHSTIEFLYEAAIKGGEVLDTAIQGIHYIVNERPFDWDLVMRDLLGDHMFGVLSDENADFIFFYKGFMAYQDGISKWKENAFAKIRPETTYSFRAMYVDIVDNVRRWKIEKALSQMEELVKSDIIDKKFRNQLFQTYGRILYQKKRYFEAYDTFRVIDLSVEDSEELYLEKAWTLFYLQDYQGALGNLLSLDAPIYRGYNKPERFVLQGLIFQRLCQWDLAQDTIKSFHKTYDDTLRTIKQRKNLDENPFMYEAFKRHPDVRKEVDFLDLLRWERRRLEDYEGSLDNSGLYKKLVEIYDYKLDEIFEKIDRKKDKAYEGICEVLLDAEEQINFLEYEVSMDKLKKQRIIDPTEQMKLIGEEIGEEEILSEDVFRWPFEGEFWTDELGSHRVLVNDVCAGAALEPEE